LASLLIILFDAREQNMLPLYAVGVFVSFTLSQSGMVIHWIKDRKREGFVPTRAWRFKLGMNAFGALCTLCRRHRADGDENYRGRMARDRRHPVLIAMFLRIHSHYKGVARSLSLDGITPSPPRTHNLLRNHTPLIVLMNSLNRSSLQALEYALQISDNVRAVAISVEPPQIEALRKKWAQWNLGEVPLDIIDSPYREDQRTPRALSTRTRHRRS
ncbi:MAG: hypothetical protein HND48_13945, partial [Chloroflexi bacterium]|nr:hypothetical protein [Chloroflexota bacterium]